MGEVITVPKKGTGADNDTVRADTIAPSWQVVEERPTEFVIEILDE